MLLKQLAICYLLINVKSIITEELNQANETEGSLGQWGEVGLCLNGTKAIGFSLKIQDNQGRKDDTALNGVALRCSNGKVATSLEGPWGEWTPFRFCQNDNFLVSARMRIEMPQFGDKAGVTNVDFRCSNGNVLAGEGMRWGTLTPWKPRCVKGVCGIASNVTPYMPQDDNTGLNNFQLYCC